MIDLNSIIPYNPGQPSARRGRAPAKWREPPGKRVWARDLSQPGSTQDDAIELSDALTPDDLSTLKSVETTPMLGSRATLPLELVVNGITDPLDKVDQFTPSDLQLPRPAKEAGLSDDDYLDIDDILSTTGKCDVKGQNEKVSDDIRHASELGGTSHDISKPEQVTERAILLESSTEPTNDDGCASSQVNLTKTVLQSQQESKLVLGGQLECIRLSSLEPAATEEKEHTSGHRNEGVGNTNKAGERSLDKKPSAKRARSLSPPKSAKRRQWRLHTRPCLEGGAEDALDAHHKMSRKRMRITKGPIDSMQSATVLDGDWLIDGIVGERQGAEGREFKVQWKPTWVAEKDVNAEDCKQRWREQKRRLKTSGSRRYR